MYHSELRRTLQQLLPNEATIKSFSITDGATVFLVVMKPSVQSTIQAKDLMGKVHRGLGRKSLSTLSSLMCRTVPLQVYQPAVNQRSKVQLLFGQLALCTKKNVKEIRVIHAGKEIKLDESGEKTLSEVGIFDSQADKPTVVHLVWRNLNKGSSTSSSGALVLSGRKNVGCGLINQGATCYMNSLLQVLRHLPQFWNIVMSIPSKPPAANERASVPLALQRLFYALLPTAPEPLAPASTEELTDAFGWTKLQARQQQDIQELMRVLLDHLDEKLKGGPRADELNRLQRLTIKMYVRCKHVDYESSRKEPHLDLGLEVKGHKDLDEALKAYIKPESLDGENRYDAGPEHGLQDATKGVSILEMPPVLHIHLKRFAYDPMRDVAFKVNDRFEFPFEMDFSAYVEPEVHAPSEKVARSAEEAKIAKRDIMDEPEAGPSHRAAEGGKGVGERVGNHIYLLQAVVVHSGGSNAGHYYAFVRPDVTTDQWVVCNDSTVAEANQEEVKATYGQTSALTTSTNAYMLTYVRKSDALAAKAALVDHPLRSVVPAHIIEHFRTKQTMEKEEQEQAKERARWMKCKAVKLPKTAISGPALDLAFQSHACHLDVLKSLHPQKLAQWLSPGQVTSGHTTQPLTLVEPEARADSAVPIASPDGIKVTLGDIATVRGGGAAHGQVWQWQNNELCPFPDPKAADGNLSTIVPAYSTTGKGLCLVVSDDELMPAKEDTPVPPVLVSLCWVREGPGVPREGASPGLIETHLGSYSLPGEATVAEVKVAVAKLIDAEEIGSEVLQVQLFVAFEQKVGLDPNSINWAKGAKLLDDVCTVHKLCDVGLLRCGCVVFVDTSGRQPVHEVVVAALPMLSASIDDDLYDEPSSKGDYGSEEAQVDVKIQEQCAEAPAPPDVTSLFKWRSDHLLVILQAKQRGAEAAPDRVVWLPRNSDYTELVARVSAVVSVKEGYLQLYRHQVTFTSVSWLPINPSLWSQGQTLDTILGTFTPKPITMQYEELELSLEEMAKTREMGVKCWLLPKPPEEPHVDGTQGKPLELERMPTYERIRVPKGGKITDLRAAAAAKLGCEAASVRLYHVYPQVSNEEVGWVLDDDTGLEEAQNMNLGKNKIYAQQVVGAEDGEELRVCHYELRGQLVKRFGEPFVFRVGAGETASQLLRRVGSWLSVDNKASEEWTVALIQGGRTATVLKELQDEDDVLFAVKAAKEELEDQFPEKEKRRADRVVHVGLRHRPRLQPRALGVTIARSPRGATVAD